MIIFPHMLIGAAIGAKIHNLPAIFILSILSHFIADKIPHWEYLDKDVRELLPGKERVIFGIKVFLDLVFGSFLIFYFLWQSPLLPLALFGAAVSISPDFFILLAALFPKIKTLSIYRNFHYKNHLSEKYRGKIMLSILSEGMVIFFALYLITS
jgi:hypothetical protein